MPKRRIAIVGAGWAGLACAVHAVQAGLEVQLFEMAHQAGGRARSQATRAGTLDNGQHVLIGAYRDTLALMRLVGVDAERGLRRTPLTLRYPDQTGVELPAGPPAWAFVRGVLNAQHWPLRHRLKLISTALGWRIKDFHCDPAWSVDELCRTLPDTIRRDMIDPLCVAALNTPTNLASGQTFLRVLHDALFEGAGSADLLLPCVPLSSLMAEPASAWLAARGVGMSFGRRVNQLERTDTHWRIDDNHGFDAVVLAVTAREAARMTKAIDSHWSHCAVAMSYQPIVTVWLHDRRLCWPQPMMALRCNDLAPAQFGFDLGALGGPSGLFSFVVSGAGKWLEQGLSTTTTAVLSQARAAFPGSFDAEDAVRHAGAERRATFTCGPALERPRMRIAQGLMAAGDYVEGPYPATLEGAVRSGRLAVDALMKGQHSMD